MLIDIEGITINANIKNVKSLRLYVTRQGEAKLTIPMTMSLQEAYEFVHKNIEWLKASMTQSNERLQEENDMMYHNMVEGEIFYNLGQKLKLHYVQHDGPTKVEESGDQLIVSSAHPLEAKEALKAVSNWYSDNFIRLIQEYVNYWLPIMGERPLNKIIIKKWQSRWATMQPAKRTATFNIRLVFYSPLAIEAIVVHELCHLKESSHNNRFHELMHLYLPDYKEREALLKRR